MDGEEIAREDDLWCHWHGHLISSYSCDYDPNAHRGGDPSRKAFPVTIVILRKEQTWPEAT